MAYNVFISFRYSDGHQYKEALSDMLNEYNGTIDFSEDEDRSRMSEYTIKNYLYGKLRKSSVTIIILTPNALNHKKDWYGKYDDWMYDEIRYSLENREGNRPNGLIALYTQESKDLFIRENGNDLMINYLDNLARKNMMNIKTRFKKASRDGMYDLLEDSYCSLISYDTFIRNPGYYIKNAEEKRDRIDEFEITARL